MARHPTTQDAIRDVSFQPLLYVSVLIEWSTKLPWLKEYMTRCHTMLAHISKTRAGIAKQSGKSWTAHWQTVEPHLDRLITDFLGGLSIHHKSICRQWVVTWSNGAYSCNDVLEDLATALA